MNFTLRSICPFIAASMIVGACTSPEAESGLGNAYFFVEIEEDECGIASAVLAVTADDIAGIEKSLDVAYGSISGYVEEVPAGLARTFTVSALNSSSFVVYSGSATADVANDETVELDIILDRNFTTCPSAGPSGAAYFDSILNNGADSDELQLWLPFDKDDPWNDISQNDFAVTPSSLAPATGFYGVNGDSIDCDGSRHVSMPPEAFDGAEDFSISMWVRPSSTGDLFWAASETDIAVWLYTGGMWLTGEVQGTNVAVEIIADTAWSHVALVRSGSNIDLYVNYDEKHANVSSASSPPAPLEVGGDLDTLAICYGVFGFDGLVDEVKLWTRALNFEELWQEYAAGNP